MFHHGRKFWRYHLCLEFRLRDCALGHVRCAAHCHGARDHVPSAGLCGKQDVSIALLEKACTCEPSSAALLDIWCHDCTYLVPQCHTPAAANRMQTTAYYIPLYFQFTKVLSFVSGASRCSNTFQGDSALGAAVRLLPFIVMIVFFALVNGGLMPKLGYYMPWYLFGSALVLIGSALMCKH